MHHFPIDLRNGQITFSSFPVELLRALFPALNLEAGLIWFKDCGAPGGIWLMIRGLAVWSSRVHSQFVGPDSKFLH